MAGVFFKKILPCLFACISPPRRKIVWKLFFSHTARNFEDACEIKYTKGSFYNLKCKRLLKLMTLPSFAIFTLSLGHAPSGSLSNSLISRSRLFTVLCRVFPRWRFCFTVSSQTVILRLYGSFRISFSHRERINILIP